MATSPTSAPQNLPLVQLLGRVLDEDTAAQQARSLFNLLYQQVVVSRLIRRSKYALSVLKQRSQLLADRIKRQNHRMESRVSLKKESDQYKYGFFLNSTYFKKIPIGQSFRLSFRIIDHQGNDRNSPFEVLCELRILNLPSTESFRPGKRRRPKELLIGGGLSEFSETEGISFKKLSFSAGSKKAKGGKFVLELVSLNDETIKPLELQAIEVIDCA